MKTVTIRISDKLANELDQESRSRRVSISEVMRERLRDTPAVRRASMKQIAGDLVGSVKGLPADLSSNKKKYLLP